MCDAEQREKQAQYTKKVGKNLVAGAMARGLAAVIMFPIDVVKTRMQFQRSSALQNHNIRTYKNGIDAFFSIIREEGILRMYKGLPMKLVYITPAAAVSFTVYEQFMTNVNAELQKKNSSKVSWTLPLLTLAAGGFARVLGTACRTPFDILKQQLQIEGQIYGVKSKTIMQTIKHVLQQQGLKGFWSGYSVTLLRDAPFAAIYFTSYEALKRLQLKLLEKRDFATGYNKNEKTTAQKSAAHFISGAFAGAIATLCTIPIDVVKTRLQTQSQLAEIQYNGIADAFKKIYREEGRKAFTKGLGPRLAYIMPAAALTFTIYEKLKDYIAFSYNSEVPENKT